MDETHRRHAEYFLRLNAGAVQQLSSARFRRWHQRGDAEVENMRLALEWAVAHDPELALRLGREVAWYFATRGANTEARQWLERGLAAAEHIPDDLRAGALLDSGMYAITYGQFEAGRRYVEEALALYRRLGDAVGAAHCVHHLGRLAMWQGRDDEAISLIEEAIGELRRADDWSLTVAHGNLGAVLVRSGKLDRAAAVLEEGLAVGERRGDSWACVVILFNLGELELKRGDLPRARQVLRRALLLHHDLRDPRYIAQSLEVCAWLATAEGTAAHVACLLGAASRIRETIGVPVPPNFQREYDRYVPIAQAQISAAQWEHAWAEGRALSQFEAVDVALQGLA